MNDEDLVFNHGPYYGLTMPVKSTSLHRLHAHYKNAYEGCGSVGTLAFYLEIKFKVYYELLNLIIEVNGRF